MPLAHRVVIPELMDDPALDAAEHDRALRGLERINRWSHSADILWPPLTAACRRTGSLRVLDVATGAGDVPAELAHRARAAGLNITFEACDASAQALLHAQKHAKPAGAAIRFFQHDALQCPLPTDAYDAVMCSLFLHHVAVEGVVPFLKNMSGAAGQLVLINDLERSRLGLAMAWLGTRILSRSKIVHVDGPRSVRAALTREEAVAAAEAAGMAGATAARRWPCRYLLQWERA
jgi:2-polyprenyl-3-methyl-5-hydroxy-6-metoxy-1,4-benzoquinol methylase